MKKTWEITLHDGRVLKQSGTKLTVDAGSLLILHDGGVGFAAWPGGWLTCKPLREDPAPPRSVPPDSNRSH